MNKNDIRLLTCNNLYIPHISIGIYFAIFWIARPSFLRVLQRSNTLRKEHRAVQNIVKYIPILFNQAWTYSWLDLLQREGLVLGSLLHHGGPCQNERLTLFRYLFWSRERKCKYFYHCSFLNLFYCYYCSSPLNKIRSKFSCLTR